MSKTNRLLLATVAIAVVLGVGAVTAYAGLADDTTPPTTTSDAAASYWNDAVVTLTATDNEGIAYIYHELDNGIVRLHRVGGKPVSATLTAPRDWSGNLKALAPGQHKLKFWAQDINGNVEAPHTVIFAVKADHDAPVTTATGATAGVWVNTAVTVHLASDDGPAGSGVASITSILDGGAPVVANAAETDVVIAGDGAHTLVFRAQDAVGNVEADKSLSVNIDTVKPTPKASAATAYRGKTAKLKFTVVDPAPNGGTATGKLVVKNPAGKVVKTVKYAGLSVNVPLTARFGVPRTWKAGTYRFFVYATDTAGNTQAKVAVARLVIK